MAKNKNPCLESSPERESVAELVSSREANDGVELGGGDLKPECPKNGFERGLWEQPSVEAR